MKYSCCDDTVRRNAVKDHPTLNGIDFLEVVDNPGDPFDQRQTTLMVHFLKPLIPGSLVIQNVIITGGERIQNIQVIDVSILAPASPPDSPLSSPPASPLYDDSGSILVVKVSGAGDYSIYTLQLVQDREHPVPPPGFDLILSSVDFSFKVLCESDFDCADSCACEDETPISPSINYLAKDFSSFRQLMLDRIAVTAPEWKERHLADLGITLVELLAYVGDYLSYRQDAIATEAYLGTARRRVSVRRHVRLVDYLMHDGCNARVWVQVSLGSGTGAVTIKKRVDDFNTQLYTKIDALSGVTVIRPGSKDYETATNSDAQVFELMEDADLYSDHNTMDFYTWQDRECCLPAGAVTATLDGGFPNLKKGHVLVFKEVLGPRTGVPEDADPTHRVAVRLTDAAVSSDPLYDRPVTEITWDPADALPFPICISARNDTQYFEKVSLALGNIVLADHGRTIVDSTASSLDPDIVPQPNPALADLSGGCNDGCALPVARTKPQRYYPMVMKGPLTQAAPYTPLLSATAAMLWSVETAVPSITLTEQAAPGQERSGQQWTAARDLLEAEGTTQAFVVEVETTGDAYLRFGDDIMGSRPAPGTRFLATYRIGNGKQGNIGHDSLAHIVSADPLLVAHLAPDGSISNPMPAKGGVEPEPVEEARQKAPQAFRTQERAVIGADYEFLTRQGDATVQRATSTMRWTGSWRTAFVSVDRLGARPVDGAFETSIRNYLEPYRMAGLDLEVDGPVYVSLDIEMNVCIEPGYFGGDVKAALLQVFSNKVLTNGRLGIFHPDNFTFGQTVYLSPLYAAAQQVPGVRSVEFTKFQRQGEDRTNAVDSGLLLLGRLEIARCDNDPNYPEHGIFTPNIL